MAAAYFGVWSAKKLTNLKTGDYASHVPKEMAAADKDILKYLIMAIDFIALSW